MGRKRTSAFLASGVILATSLIVHAHGDVNPQPVDTAGLPDVGEEWLIENPYRADSAGEDLSLIHI